MNRYQRLFFCFFVLLFSYHQKMMAQPSYDWFKGWWQYYNIRPNTLRGQNIESELEITNISGDNYSGIQKVWCSNDTLSMVKRECKGLLANGDVLFLAGKETYRKEPQNIFIWNAYTKYEIDTSYFSVSRHKLILHIKVKSAQDNFVKEFAYYRDLVPLPFSLRMLLEKRYGSPQVAGDTDSVKIVKPLEPDMDDTTTYVSVSPGSDNVPAEIISRKNTLVKTLTVTSSDIQVIILDDAEIDNDIISLYHNNELVLSHKTIGKEMVKYALKADAGHPHHEFTLVAENLGSIPPNTALVRIRAGETKYEFIVHSDLNENVKFVINYVDDKKIDVTTPKN